MIHPILCEGRNDSWFLDELVKNKCSVSPVSLHGDFTGFNQIYRNNFGKHKCLSKEIHKKPCIIILSDNGHDLINRYVPYIIRSYFAVFMPLELHYIVLKDSDESNPKSLLRSYYRRISDSLQSKGMKCVDLKIHEDDYTITLTSEQNPHHSFHFHFIFVPPSLEKKLVSKSFENNRSLLRRYKARIENMGPHEALDEIARHLGINKENLIRKSVLEGWFHEEDWYVTLVQSVRDHLDFSTGPTFAEC